MKIKLLIIALSISLNCHSQAYARFKNIILKEISASKPVSIGFQNDYSWIAEIIGAGTAQNSFPFTPGSLTYVNYQAGPMNFAAYHGSSYIRFFTAGYAIGNERMRIDTVGRVGIGTTTFSSDIGAYPPKFRIVQGSTVFEVNDNNGDPFTGISNGTIKVYGMHINTAQGAGVTGTNSNHPFRIRTNNLTKIRCDTGSRSFTAFMGPAGYDQNRNGALGPFDFITKGYSDSVRGLATPFDNILKDSLTTTNATPATIQTIVIPNNFVDFIETTIEGLDIGDSAIITGKKIFSVKRIGPTTLRTINTPAPTEADAAISTATFSITVSGTDIIIQVTGVASKTIEWKVVSSVVKRSTGL